MLACWVAFPLVLGLLGYGCGALVERAAGLALPLSVRLPCGVALTIAVLDLFTRSTAMVGAAIPVVCGLAAGGLVLRRPWRTRRLDWRRLGERRSDEPGSDERRSDERRLDRRRSGGALVAPVVVFAVYAAPIVLSGAATWAGYVKLDDTATWLALVDRTLTAGHTLAGLAPSTYTDTLAAYLTNGYPVGSFLPLGLGHALLGQDIAWLTDPWMAFMAAMLALSLQRIAALALGERAPRWWAPAIAILAAQPALLYGYYLWGGMKELAGAMLVAAFASAAPLAWEGGRHTALARRVRATVPALVVVWAILAALSGGGLVWLLPGGMLALLLLAPRGRLRLPSPAILLPAATLCGVAVFLVLRPGGFLDRYRGVLTGSGELGNLLGPLHLEQVAGIWPVGDFRLLPAHVTVTDLLIALALLAGAGGLVAAVRRAGRELALYALCSLAGALLVFWLGSPWLAGKALATASPAVVLVALVGCALLAARGRRALGLLAGVAIAGGVVWSNALGYRDASLAPRAQFAELAGIGGRIAGDGPTLMTSFSPFGARHFLRDAEPESASELRSRADPLRSGQPLPRGTTTDIDQFDLGALLAYRTLVLRRSPVASRPPSPYELILRDRYWEVWRRAPSSRPLLARMPLGDAVAPGAVPSCAALLRLARTPGARELVAPPVEDPLVVALGEASHPRRWSDDREHLTLAGPGAARIVVTVPRAGRYALWLGGSTGGPVSIAVNGVHVGTARYEVQEDAEYVPFGAIGLERGRYEVSIGYDGGDWRPGSGGPPATVGPLVLRREASEPAPLAVRPGAARSLCGRTLDWVEALGA